MGSRTPHIGLVTAATAIGHDADAPLMLAALGRAGWDAALVCWDDPTVAWDSFTTVVLRSPWDYVERYGEFLAWLDVVERLVPVLNPPPLVRWNLDKHYLRDFAAHGVATVPTWFCSTLAAVERAWVACDAAEVVVKPAVSAGSRRTGRFRTGDPTAQHLARAILDNGDVVLIQPAVPSVAEHGEVALVYFGGVFSHAVRKGPLLALGGGLTSGDYTEAITATTPPPPMRHLADATVAALTPLGHHRGFTTPPLYARIDVVATDAGPALLEAELCEPAYFLTTDPAAVDRFVVALTQLTEDR